MKLTDSHIRAIHSPRRYRWNWRRFAVNIAFAVAVVLASAAAMLPFVMYAAKGVVK